MHLQRLKLTFKDLDLEPSDYCGHDSLHIYANHREYVITNICGTDKPDPIITEEGLKFVHFLFLTDQFVSGRGFHLQFESSPDFGNTFLVSQILEIILGLEYVCHLN